MPEMSDMELDRLRTRLADLVAVMIGAVCALELAIDTAPTLQDLRDCEARKVARRSMDEVMQWLFAGCNGQEARWVKRQVADLRSQIANAERA